MLFAAYFQAPRRVTSFSGHKPSKDADPLDFLKMLAVKGGNLGIFLRPHTGDIIGIDEVHIPRCVELYCVADLCMIGYFEVPRGQEGGKHFADHFPGEPVE